MLWVKEHLDEEKNIYSKQELCELVERYFNMFEEIISSFNNSTSAMIKAFEKMGVETSPLNNTMLGEFFKVISSSPS